MARVAPIGLDSVPPAPLSGPWRAEHDSPTRRSGREPGRASRGAVEPELYDVAPTVPDLLGPSIPAGMTGRSVLETEVRMNPVTVVVGAQDIGPSVWLQNELRARGMPCVVVIETDGSAPEAASSACTALAAGGISTVVVADPAHSSALAADLGRWLPRTLAAPPSAEATVDALQARGWIPARGEIYTEDELATVTARLRELGYA